MKYRGKNTEPNYEIVVIPRQDDPIVFRVEAVLDLKYFDAVCPEPVPVYRTYPDGRKEVHDQAEYRSKCIQYAERKLEYVQVASLANNPEIEWETVDLKNPETWKLLEQELRDAHFTPAEINVIYNAIAKANGYDSEHIEKAKADFLLSSQVDQVLASLSRMEEQANTSNGEPAKDLESVPQE